MFEKLFITAATEFLRLVVSRLTSKIWNTKDATKQRLIREIRENIKVLSHRVRGGVSKTDIINELSNDSIIEATNEGYDFNKLRRRKPRQVTIDILGDSDNYKYIGKDSKQLIEGVDSKISDLKRLLRIYENNIEITNQVNITSRFNNLYEQLVILAKLINY